MTIQRIAIVSKGKRGGGLQQEKDTEFLTPIFINNRFEDYILES